MRSAGGTARPHAGATLLRKSSAPRPPTESYV